MKILNATAVVLLFCVASLAEAKCPCPPTKHAPSKLATPHRRVTPAPQPRQPCPPVTVIEKHSIAPWLIVGGAIVAGSIIIAANRDHDDDCPTCTPYIPPAPPKDPKCP